MDIFVLFSKKPKPSQRQTTYIMPHQLKWAGSITRRWSKENGVRDLEIWEKWGGFKSKYVVLFESQSVYWTKSSLLIVSLSPKTQTLFFFPLFICPRFCGGSNSSLQPVVSHLFQGFSLSPSSGFYESSCGEDLYRYGRWCSPCWSYPFTIYTYMCIHCCFLIVFVLFFFCSNRAMFYP